MLILIKIKGRGLYHELRHKYLAIGEFFPASYQVREGGGLTISSKLTRRVPKRRKRIGIAQISNRGQSEEVGAQAYFDLCCSNCGYGPVREAPSLEPSNLSDYLGGPKYWEDYAGEVFAGCTLPSGTPQGQAEGVGSEEDDWDCVRRLLDQTLPQDLSDCLDGLLRGDAVGCEALYGESGCWSAASLDL